MTGKKRALFICFGNTCRSPMAEAVFIQSIKDKKISDDWIVESAAISKQHVGRGPDYRVLLTLKKHGLTYRKKARQIKLEDFTSFDYLLAMDENNMSDLKQMAPEEHRAEIFLLGQFDTERNAMTNIKDPYFGKGSEGFKTCYEQCVRCCDGFLKELAENRI